MGAEDFKDQPGPGPRNDPKLAQDMAQESEGWREASANERINTRIFKNRFDTEGNPIAKEEARKKMRSHMDTARNYADVAEIIENNVENQDLERIAASKSKEELNTLVKQVYAAYEEYTKFYTTERSNTENSPEYLAALAKIVEDTKKRLNKLEDLLEKK